MNGWVIARRNLRIFFRDRSAVFFSLLSSLILIALYALFLGNLQVQSLEAQFSAATTTEIAAFVDAWVFAGITMITTVTTGLAALSVFIDDRTSGRFGDFLVSPIKRTQLIIGYLLSSFLIALVMTVVIVIVSQVYTAVRGNPVMTPAQLAQTLGYVALSAAAFSAIAACLVTFLTSNGAFSAFSTIVGTMIGFLAGAYIPAGTLPTGVVSVMNTLPFAQSAMLIRRPFTEASAEVLTGGNSVANNALDTFYGMSLTVGDFEVTPALAIAVLVGILVVFAALATWRLARSIR